MIPEDLRQKRVGPPRFDPGITIPTYDETRLIGIRWVRLSKVAHPNQLDREITFVATGAFRDSSAAFETARKIGIKLSFPFL